MFHNFIKKEIKETKVDFTLSFFSYKKHERTKKNAPKKVRLANLN
jgi:hypothetical protein